MNNQLDLDKYEPTRIDTLLHNTRAHSPDGWRELSKSLIELSDDDRLLIEYAPTLRAEVERLREVLKSITDDIIPPQHEGQTQVELTYKLIAEWDEMESEEDGE